MKQYKSAKHYVLMSLIPYSRPNLKLVFKPSAFFKDIDTLHKISENAARNALSRAARDGLIEYDEQNIPRLTSAGRKILAPFTAKTLEHASLMVIFDIPEADRWKRRQLRALLKEFSFDQIQKSVWESKIDCQEYIQAGIEDLDLKEHVLLFEARPL